MTDAAVTYMPKHGAFVAGEHTSVPHDWGRLETFSLEADPIGTVICDARCRDPESVELIRAYCALLVAQQKLSPLDSMFKRLDLDGTTHSEKIRTDVQGPQTVPRLGRYAANDKYGALRFNLRDSPSSYEVPTDLAKDASYARASANALRDLWKREQRAAAALKRIPYHYQKDSSGDPKSFSTEIPADNGTQRISCPDGGRSNAKMLDEISLFVCQFIECLELPPTHAACSPNTAMLMGRNTETGADPRFEEACRTCGGEFPFPGMSWPNPLTPKMVVSPACQDDVLYVTSQMLPVMLRAEGPKIIRHEPGALAVTDFFQYKCAYEDLQTDSPFACIVDLQTA